MDIKFLAQGFDEISIDAIGNHLSKFLLSKDFHKFTGFSAFTSIKAIRLMEKYFLEAKKEYNSINFILGINQRGTSKEALEAVLSLEVNSRIFYHNANYIFHPKIYIFEGAKICKIIIGSSNLTSTGLFNNIESSILVTINPKDKKDGEFLEEIKKYYKAIFDFKDPNLKPISQTLIDQLYDEGIIPTEAEQRFERSLKITHKKNGKKANSIFPKRKVPKIPAEFLENLPIIKVEEPSAKYKNYNSKTFLYTEPGYHFPQGVHIGHILYVLKTLDNNKVKNSHIDPKYIKLRGKYDSGDLGKFQRKAKYLSIALMEMGIINDNRNLPKNAPFAISLTNKGKELAKILHPLLDIGNLEFKVKKAGKLSWEMVANKTHYVSLVKAILLSSSQNMHFWQDLIIKMPAVSLMNDFLYTSEEVEIPKTNYIYKEYFSYPPIKSFCDSLGFKAGQTEASAGHRCPFLLDLLEMGNFIIQENKFVIINK